jgi:hypothetical protein
MSRSISLLPVGLKTAADRQNVAHYGSWQSQRLKPSGSVSDPRQFRVHVQDRRSALDAPASFSQVTEAYMTYVSNKSTNPSLPNFAPGAFGEMGKKQFEAALEMQKELLGAFEEINRAWVARAQSEVTLASEFVGKLATVRSIPDAATACQECMSRQMEMFAEDSRRMLADGEKLMRAGARLFSSDSAGLST